MLTKQRGSGSYRTPVFLGRPVITIDAAGGESLTWDEFATWANFDNFSGREWTNQLAVKDSVDSRIRLRLIPGWIPEARWRIRHAETSRIYDLVAVMPDEKTATVECVARTAPGNSDGR